jgi:hypothetical protein
LVQNASGLFIWTATGCRFIREGLFAEERLQTLPQDGASVAATSEEHLDRIDVTVLQNSRKAGLQSAGQRDILLQHAKRYPWERRRFILSPFSRLFEQSTRHPKTDGGSDTEGPSCYLGYSE